MKHPKPLNITDAEWEIIKKSLAHITEHFQNAALFLNWVNDEGETQHLHILKGNGFAIQNHIGKWIDGDFDEDEGETEKVF